MNHRSQMDAAAACASDDLAKALDPSLSVSFTKPAHTEHAEPSQASSVWMSISAWMAHDSHDDDPETWLLALPLLKLHCQSCTSLQDRAHGSNRHACLIQLL